jgi:2-methylisocitrate lyase-like PEP mutase family enzyme
MPITTADKCAAFRKLHETGCFALPNPYDVGSAKALAHLGFKALASTSAGFAWTIGTSDNRVTLEDVLAHLTALCGAVDLPVNADFEGGFAHKPDKDIESGRPSQRISEAIQSPFRRAGYSRTYTHPSFLAGTWHALQSLE